MTCIKTLTPDISHPSSEHYGSHLEHVNGGVQTSLHRLVLLLAALSSHPCPLAKQHQCTMPLCA